MINHANFNHENNNNSSNSINNKMNLMRDAPPPLDKLIEMGYPGQHYPYTLDQLHSQFQFNQNRCPPTTTALCKSNFSLLFF
ncbi:unnamed protein product [Trichobilharzia regenti]|nr:unnamed protein product [Trichobilharzia regenti]